MLVAHAEFGKSVIWQNALVVGREYVSEELVGDGEERELLDIRVMFRVISDDVVNLIQLLARGHRRESRESRAYIVASLPPAHRETSKEVRNDDAHTGIKLEVVGDSHVAGIVCREYELMPEAS